MRFDESETMLLSLAQISCINAHKRQFGRCSRRKRMMLRFISELLRLPANGGPLKSTSPDSSTRRICVNSQEMGDPSVSQDPQLKRFSGRDYHSQDTSGPCGTPSVTFGAKLTMRIGSRRPIPMATSRMRSADASMIAQRLRCLPNDRRRQTTSIQNGGMPAAPAR